MIFFHFRLSSNGVSSSTSGEQIDSNKANNNPVEEHLQSGQRSPELVEVRGGEARISFNRSSLDNGLVVSELHAKIAKLEGMIGAYARCI